MLVLKNALTLSVYLKSHYYVLITTYIPSTLTREALVRQYHYQSSYPGLLLSTVCSNTEKLTKRR